MSAPKWAVGMQKIGPGTYVKGSELHFDANEICHHLGVPCTPENLRIAEAAARESLSEAFGDMPIEVTED